MSTAGPANRPPVVRRRSRLGGSVSMTMVATPLAVWDCVSDVTRIGEFSPETEAGEWLDGATGPALGARFRGRVRRNGVGPVYWSPCRVVACEPGRLFAFAVGVGAGDGWRPLNTWRYDIAPEGAGVRVTESFRLTDSLPTRVYWALLGRARGRTNLAGMTATLERVRDAVEPQPGNSPRRRSS